MDSDEQMQVIANVGKAVKPDAPTFAELGDQILDRVAVIRMQHGELAAGFGGSEHEVERLLGVDRARGLAFATRELAAMSADRLEIESGKRRLFRFHRSI